MTTPEYARLDEAVFIKISPTVQLQVNVENLTDKKYFAYTNGDNNITPGLPRAVRATRRSSFWSPQRRPGVTWPTG